MSLTPVLTAAGALQHAGAFTPSVLLPIPNPRAKISAFGAKKRTVHGCRRGSSAVQCSSSEEQRPPEESDTPKLLDGEQLPIFRPWTVPWDWKVVVFVMMPYVMSAIATGVVGNSGLGGSMSPYSESITQLYSTDEAAIRMFFDQLLKSVAKLSILYMFVYQYQPFAHDIFSFRWDKPLNHYSGWLLWAIGGLAVAGSGVYVLKFFTTPTNIQMPNEAEPLVRLLPLIGSSGLSTVCLLGIVGILAPICEEILYRGFLLTSLTKWFSVPLAVVLSSAIFAFGHQSPGKSLEIFIFGNALGLVYAQTRNLNAPIAMHACWNSVVILTLTFLHMQGYDIQQILVLELPPED